MDSDDPFCAKVKTKEKQLQKRYWLKMLIDLVESMTT